MKMKNMFVIGILGMLLAVGAMSAAMAQSTGSNKTKEAQSHECTSEMMENMSKNCPKQMMQSETYENMMNATNESSMMISGRQAESTKTAGADHCEDMDSDNGSMMDSSVAITKAML